MVAIQIGQEPSSPTEKKQLPTPPPELATLSTTEVIASQKPETMSTEKSTQTSGAAASQVVVDAKAEPKSENVADSNTSPKSESTEVSSDAKDSKSDDKDKTDKKDDDKDKKDADKDKKDEKKALPRGMKSDLKLLWAKTDAQCKCCTTWVEENPDDGKNVEESDECLQHAIVVRKKKKHEGNRKPLKVDSIVVHSPLIKMILQRVFSGYPDLVVDMEELIFDAPFAAFFHRWSEFETAYKEETDAMTKAHLKLLYDALDAELRQPIQRHKDLIRHKAIDFELLWTLFRPGSLMYSHDNGHDRLYETNDCEYWQDLSGMKFTVRCDMVDWDGEKFGKMTLSENISKFKGTRQITTLPSYPLQFHPKADEMKKKCIERGRRFQGLAGVHCKDYKGTAIEYIKYSVQTVSSKRQLEGRIMLDEELFSKFMPDEAMSLRDLDDDDEDVAKAEKEASERLAEQARKAKEALKKAEEEQKKKDEEEQKKKDEEEKKKKNENKTGSQDGEKTSTKEDEKTASKDDEKTALEDSDKTVSKDDHSQEVVEKPSETTEQKSEEATTKDHAAATETKLEASTDGKHEETKKVSGSVPNAVTSTDEKNEETSSSASTDSEGIPTPASESEDSVEKPIAFSSSEKQELKECHFAICSSWLRGYSLSYQKWCSFSVAHISDVTWNDDAFSQLTLPDEYRELILATIQSQIHQNRWKQKMDKVEKEQKPLSELYKDDADADEDEGNSAEFDDFIAAKGLGYIMLFSGSPGVGKTATAESIAELLHVPLCIISVGNLGTSAESVESELQDILELASKWNAVLLLDEADIGILLLTTNRSEEIDEAFHSRIHISLPFPDLTEGNREKIWKHFASITNKKHEMSAARRKKAKQPPATTDTTPPASDPDATTNGTKTTESPQPTTDEHHFGSLIDLSTSDFRKLSQTQLNGRQIKNAFKTAVLLASYKKEKVQMKHVKTALKTIDGNGLGKREVGGMYY